jgi:hypothetical protein
MAMIGSPASRGAVASAEIADCLAQAPGVSVVSVAIVEIVKMVGSFQSQKIDGVIIINRSAMPLLG